MLAVARSMTLLGIDAVPVSVEVDLQRGLPSFSTVGLPGEAVRESRDRVRAAIVNAGFSFPDGRVTVNLAPADLKKEGSRFDLAIALGLLAAGGQVKASALGGLVLVGELSLDGRLKGVRGILPTAMAAVREEFQGMLLPPDNAREAALVGGLEVFPVSDLAAAVGHVNGTAQALPWRASAAGHDDQSGGEEDLSDVRGQEQARRALEVAAAGGHNILMIGPPGSGKTMLARRLPSIMPSLTFDESLETARIHSVAGLLSSSSPLLQKRPFRNPHHTISYAGLIGGGAFPRPGEVSLSHNGVLFLDELPEFSRSVMEVLRQPLESGDVTISRAAISLTFPAAFMLVAAMNPCKCGWLGHPTKTCRCTPREVERYRGKISGPLLDRIDLHVEVPALEYGELMGDEAGEASAPIRGRVEEARHLQRRRFTENGGNCNAFMNAGQVREHCRLDRGSDDLLKSAVERLGFSARSIVRVLKVARTVADLEECSRIEAAHIAEAIQYRSLDRSIC